MVYVASPYIAGPLNAQCVYTSDQDKEQVKFALSGACSSFDRSLTAKKAHLVGNTLLILWKLEQSFGKEILCGGYPINGEVQIALPRDLKDIKVRHVVYGEELSATNQEAFMMKEEAYDKIISVINSNEASKISDKEIDLLLNFAATSKPEVAIFPHLVPMSREKDQVVFEMPFYFPGGKPTPLPPFRS